MYVQKDSKQHRPQKHQKTKLEHQKKERKDPDPKANYQIKHLDKLYKGLFISKLRNKQGEAGRIKASQFKCKINVRYNNGALHESEVYWREFSRRWIQKPSNHQKLKYVQKKEESPQDKQIVSENKDTDKSTVEIKQQKEEIQSKITEQLNSMKLESNQQRPQEDKQIKDEQESLDESEEDDFMINAKIVEIIDSPHEHRNIVCTIWLQRNKYESSRHKNPLIAIEEDYFIDVFPINSRLERFTVKDLEPLKNFVPKDRKQALKFFDTHYFSLKYLNWSPNDKYPFGKIMNVVSQGFTPEGQSEALLHELDLIDYDQSKQEAQIQLQITPQHKDYRNLFVFTIDPATSIDLDDALSIQQVQNGFEVGIHISDVTSYLHLLDRSKLCKLATSAYLPYTAKHMLPKQLVNICTLGPNADRLAFSVFVIVNKKAEVQSVRFEKAIIHSKAKLSYEHAQSVIEGSQPKFPQYVDDAVANLLKQKIQRLNKLAQYRRRKRTLLDLFNNTEIKFELNQKNYPTDIKKYERQQSNKMVEEFMLLANELVAKRLVQGLPKDAIIIHHPVPSKTNRDYFNKMFVEYGFQLNFDDMKKLEENIIGFIGKSDNKMIHELLKMKASRMQELAQYKRISSNKEGHFALSMESYTHFTSPMRRFSDVIAAEQLMKCMKSSEPLQLSPEDRTQLDSELLIMNSKRRSSKRLKSQILQKFLALLIRNINSFIESDAVLVTFGISSCTILVPDYDLQRDISWKEELDIIRVKQYDKIVEVCFSVERKQYVWRLEKHGKLKVRIDSTTKLPLSLIFHLLVEIDGKQRMIRAYKN